MERIGIIIAVMAPVIILGMSLLAITLDTLDNIITGAEDCQAYLASQDADPRVILSLDGYNSGNPVGVVRHFQEYDRGWTLEERVEFGRYLRQNGLADVRQGGGSNARACRKIALFPR